MANTASAKKRIRQNEKRRMRNKVWLSRARTTVKEARTAIDSGDREAAENATMVAIKHLDKAASKGVIHNKNASRRKSRLMKRLAAMEA